MIRRKGRALWAVMTLCLVMTCLQGCRHTLKLTLKAGTKLTEELYVEEINVSPHIQAYGADCLNHAGSYSIPCKAADGTSYTLSLRVVDRRAPVVVPRHVYVAQGSPVPPPEACIGSIEEPDHYTAAYVGDLPVLDRLGDYDVSFCVTDASGNKTKTLHTVISVVRDDQPPVFVTVPELSAFVGESIAYRQGLVVTDNCSGEVDITVDASTVNTAFPGDYTVHYTATDGVGNVATASTTVHIYASQMDEATLMARVTQWMEQITTPSMSVEDKLREAYAYIQSHIAYVSDSDKSDWVRAAYDSLFVTGTGDCFNYFAAAKAVIKYLGLDYREIQRTPGFTPETHYWLMVNIGTSASPRWYHYDCTRLRAEYNHSGCLLTDQQINAYNKVRPYFYAYNASTYPASAKEIITPTKALEPYY